MTAEENDRPHSAQERVHSRSVSPADHTDHSSPAVRISEIPPSGPPSIADWNMSDIFSFPSPGDSSWDDYFPSLLTADSRMPDIGLGGLENHFTNNDNSSAPQVLSSLQDITRELSTINLTFFRPGAISSRRAMGSDVCLTSLCHYQTKQL